MRLRAVDCNTIFKGKKLGNCSGKIIFDWLITQIRENSLHYGKIQVCMTYLQLGSELRMGPRVYFVQMQFGVFEADF
jgi:hypothetical protein